MNGDDNPFERYEIDPHEGPRGITERMRELAEDATDDAERARIRAAWEELTVHVDRRLRAALLAHPESRAPVGSPPPAPRAPGDVVGPKDLDLADLVGLPPIAEMLGLPPGAEDDGDDSDPLARDPVLSPPAPPR